MWIKAELTALAALFGYRRFSIMTRFLLQENWKCTQTYTSVLSLPCMTSSLIDLDICELPSSNPDSVSLSSVRCVWLFCMCVCNTNTIFVFITWTMPWKAIPFLWPISYHDLEVNFSVTGTDGYLLPKLYVKQKGRVVLVALPTMWYRSSLEFKPCIF